MVHFRQYVAQMNATFAGCKLSKLRKIKTKTDEKAGAQGKSIGNRKGKPIKTKQNRTAAGELPLAGNHHQGPARG